MSSTVKPIVPSTQARAIDVPFLGAWGFAFIAIAALVSIPIHLLQFLTIGLSASSDAVFGVEALLSGIVSDQILKRKLRKRVVALQQYPISILWAFVPLCLFVILASPFE